MPNDFLAGNEFRDLLCGAVYILITVRKLGAGFVGVALDCSRPPSTNIVDGSEGFMRSLFYRNGSGKILCFHESPFVLSVARFANLSKHRCALRHEARVLALERLGYATAPALRDGLENGIGEDILFVSLQPIEDALRH